MQQERTPTEVEVPYPEKFSAELTRSALSRIFIMGPPGARRRFLHAIPSGSPA